MPRGVKKGSKAAAPVHEEEEQVVNSYSPEIEALIAKGKEAGFVTQQEVIAAVGDVEDAVDEIEDMHALLLENKVEVLETTDDDFAEAAEAEAANVESDDYVKDIADDSVRLYLREIGRFPMLKPDEEYALAQLVQRGTLVADWIS